MIVLGIDPGSLKTGYGIIHCNKRDCVHIASGTIKLPQQKKLGLRLSILHTELNQLIQQHRPEHLAIENIFTKNNIQSTLKLGQARGVCILTGALHNVEIWEYSPAEIKQAITGYGVASKDQVEFMVKKILKLSQPLGKDESDAIAVALTHHYIYTYKMRLGIQPGAKTGTSERIRL